MFQILDKIDGLLISGGRDMDPKFYDQEITKSLVFPETELRYI